jgi:hypothetical protein
VQFKMVRTPLHVSPDEPTQNLHSFDSYTRLDGTLNKAHRLTAAFAVFPRTLDYGNLDTFNPREVTARFKQTGFDAGASESAVLSSTSVLESTVNFKKFDANVGAYGNAPMVLTPDGNRGNFFNRQQRDTDSIQWIEALTIARHGPAGDHLMKFGLDVLRATFSGSSVSLPVEVFRENGTLTQRIDFLGPTAQDAAGTDAAFFAQDRWQPIDRVVVEGGVRLERDGTLDEWHVSPRMGATLRLTSDGSTTARGGVGSFFQRSPLNVAVFDSYQAEQVTSFGADGLIAGGRQVFVHQTGALSTPRGVAWNAELDRKISSALAVKVNYLHRSGSNEFVVNPLQEAAGPVLLLASSGHSRYHETEITGRWAHGARQELIVSYVRSHSEADLNTYDAYFGNLRKPIIRPNEFSLTDIDVPNRVVVRGSVGLPGKWDVVPVLEIRDGFPYSIVDENRDFVGPQNLGGRYPTLATLDVSVQRPFRILKWKPRVGFRVLNVLGRANPRDVQNNIDSPAFGQFSNPIERFFGLTFWFDR